MDTVNMKQLEVFVSSAVNLIELDLTRCVSFRTCKHQVPEDFLIMMKALVSPASCSKNNLRKIGLANNLLGEDMMKTIIDDCLTKFTKLEQVDISANKLGDDGFKYFF